MRVLLTTPPYDKNRFRLGESLGLKYLAAVLLQKGVEAYVLEPTLRDWDIEKTANFIIEKKVDFLGISVQFSRGLSNAVRVMEMVKKHTNPHISIGGHFATFHYDELLESIDVLDSVVMYEGELTIVELLEKLYQPEYWHEISGLAFRNKNGKVQKTTPRPLIQNLDTLPFPLRDETSGMARDPHYSVISSRGCLLCCTFCSVPSFYNDPVGARWRVRSPENVVDELEMLSRDYHATEISFLDDNFIGSNKAGRKRASFIAKEMIKRRLNLRWSIECRTDDVESGLLSELINAGLSHINLGIESGSQAVLSNFKKLTTIDDNQQAIETIRSLGIGAYYHFIMFSANTTLEEIESSINFIRECGIANFTVVSNRLDIYKGTAEYQKLSNEKRLIKKGYEYTFQFPDPRVELVYQAIHRSLIAIYDVELAIEKASFHNDTRTSGYSPRNHFSWSSLKDNNKLHQLELRLSDKTSELLKQIIYFVRNNEKITKSGFSSFITEIEQEAKLFSGEMLSNLMSTYSEA